MSEKLKSVGIRILEAKKSEPWKSKSSLFKLVEMAGVEPASPGLSAETSTRLASRLNFGGT